MTTHADIARHLDLSKRAVPDLLKKLGLPSRGADIDQARTAYIQHLRKIAAGHQSASGMDLTQERAKLAAIQREKTEIEVERLRNTLVPVDEVQTAAFNAGRQIRSAWEN
ncbi:MAG: hypothetical protein HQL67_12460 [Magnetococcales bacterium]|nr:hypothetical protein [Magnetococcales bacterium]